NWRTNVPSGENTRIVPSPASRTTISPRSLTRTPRIRWNLYASGPSIMPMGRSSHTVQRTVSAVEASSDTPLQAGLAAGAGQAGAPGSARVDPASRARPAIATISGGHGHGISGSTPNGMRHRGIVDPPVHWMSDFAIRDKQSTRSLSPEYRSGQPPMRKALLQHNPNDTTGARCAARPRSAREAGSHELSHDRGLVSAATVAIVGSGDQLAARRNVPAHEVGSATAPGNESALGTRRRPRPVPIVYSA